MRKNKNRKTSKITPSQSQSATVNDLPDEILTHILSFLPIKEAFKTIILSKRWLPLCYSLSVLHIDDFQTNNWIHLRQLIDKLMLSPLAHNITLKSFHLNCSSIQKNNKANCFSFRKWIEAAKRRRVEELYLFYLYDIPSTPTILSCKTLVILNLKYSVVLFRCSVDLPLLKTLELFCVKFRYRADVMKFVSGCPMLENLKTSFVKGRAISPVTVEGCYKPLSKFIKAEIDLFDVPFRALCNIKFLSLWKMEKSLSNKEISSYYKDFPVFENLTELQLHWLDLDRLHHIYDWSEVVKMLQNCPKLQTLNIRKEVNLTTKEDWEYPDNVPECFSSHLTTCTVMYYEANKADFRFATYILQNASLLQVMQIYSLVSRQCLEDLISCPRISPACKLSLIDMNVSSS